MSSRSRWAVATGAAVLLVILGVFLARPGPATFDAPTRAAAAVDSKPDVARSPAPGDTSSSAMPAAGGTGPAPSTGPLPTLDTPVREVLVALKARANAGDVRAACRVGMELSRCRTVRLFRSLQENDERRLRAAKPGSNEFMAIRDSIEAQKKFHAAERRACEGVGDDVLNSAWRYLLRAAQAGHVPSISHFLVAPPLPESAIEDLAGYEAYRDHAPSFFDRAIAAGDVPAALAAYTQWSHGRGTGGGKVYERDPQRALTFAYLLLPLVDARTADALRFDLKVLEAEPRIDIATARREADRLRQVNFVRAAPADAAMNVGAPVPAACE